MGAAAGTEGADAARAAMALAEDDKLILTPALRIVEDAEPARPPEEAARPFEAAPPAAPGPAQPASNEGRAPDAAAADEGPVLSFTSVRASPLTLDASQRSDVTEGSPGPRPADPASAPITAGVTQPPVAGLGAVLSSIGSAVDQNREEWESETGDSGFGSFAWKRPEWGSDIASPMPDAPLVEADNGLSPTEAEAAEAAARAEIEAAERAESEDETRQQQAGTARAERDRGAEHRAWFGGSEDDDGPDGADDAIGAAGPHYDEALLRDLVRDIIREELSGTLGERITRNVRKLVRAEIARALTSRDFN